MRQDKNNKFYTFWSLSIVLGVAGKQLHQVVVGGSETSTYLEGLHPGTSYSVQVLAENGVGLSEPSQSRHVQVKEEGKKNNFKILIFFLNS